MITLLFLLACAGNQPGDSGSDSNTNDSGHETGDTDTQTGTGVNFTLQAPDGITDALAFVEHHCDAEYDGEETCQTSGNVTDTQDVNPLPYVFNATIPTNYEFLFDSSTAISEAQQIVVDSDTQDQVVTWASGGCQDAGWSTDGAAACNNWVGGAWGLAPSGTYHCEECNYDTGVSVAHSTDVTGDGVPDLVMSFDNGGLSNFPVVLAGNQGYSSVQDRGTLGFVISDDLQQILEYNYVTGEGPLHLDKVSE